MTSTRRSSCRTRSRPNRGCFLRIGRGRWAPPFHLQASIPGGASGPAATLGQASKPGMRIGGHRIGPAILVAQRFRLLGDRDIALAFDRAAAAAAAAESGEGEILGKDDLDVAVVVLAPGAREVPALRQLGSQRLGGPWRVALQLADH